MILSILVLDIVWLGFLALEDNYLASLPWYSEGTPPNGHLGTAAALELW